MREQVHGWEGRSGLLELSSPPTSIFSVSLHGWPVEAGKWAAGSPPTSPGPISHGQVVFPSSPLSPLFPEEQRDITWRGRSLADCRGD
jgi:hypothetical protein